MMTTMLGIANRRRGLSYLKKGEIGQSEGTTERLEESRHAARARTGQEEWSVTKNGEAKWVSMRQLAATQLALKGAKGDLKALGMISAMTTSHEDRGDRDAALEVFSAPHDKAVMSVIVDRIASLAEPGLGAGSRR